MFRPVFTLWLTVGLAAPASGEASPPGVVPPVQRPQVEPSEAGDAGGEAKAPPAPTTEPSPGTEPPTPAVQRPSSAVTNPPVTPETRTGTQTTPPVRTPPVRQVEPPPPPIQPIEPLQSESNESRPSTILPPADTDVAIIDPVSQAERAEATRRLVGARTMMAVGGVSLATGLMMVLGAVIEASKKPCDFEESCEDPPRSGVVRGLAAGGGVLTALGAVAVGFSIPAAKRARLELDASRTQARVGLSVRF